MIETRRQWRARTSRHSTRGFLLRVARFLLALFLLYLFVNTLLISSVRVTAPSMLPTLEPGDRLLVAPIVYGPRLEAVGTRLPGFRKPARGDIVVVRPPYVPRRSFFAHAAESVVSFFTVRRVSVMEDEASVGRWVVKRVIGIPGDTVRVQDNVAYVETAGESTFVPEFTTGRREYVLDRSGLPEGWSDGFPLSGNVGEVVLGEGEYYVLGDNRVTSLDSRHWGPVEESDIVEAIILRYWPLQRIGRP